MTTDIMTGSFTAFRMTSDLRQLGNKEIKTYDTGFYGRHDKAGAHKRDIP